MDIELLRPGMQQNPAEDLLNGRFVFLNRTEEIEWPPVWQSDTLSILWLYNLHYFEWLWTLEYADAKSVVLNWIENYQLTRGQKGWEPYPISLRVMNWCGVFFGKYRNKILDDTSFLEYFWNSIFHQCKWLTSHLEVHVLGNHLFENGAALVFAGSCFDGEEASRWFNAGMKILRREIPEQILPDGMHFERSPMYHSRMLYTMAVLRATQNEEVAALLDTPMHCMVKAIETVCHPDGQIALFNDSAFGIYNQPSALLQYCRQLYAKGQQDGGQEKSRSTTTSSYICMDGENFRLPDSGYYGFSDDRGNYLICDAGTIGPDYQPGHAHADIFSFELSLKGHRVIVDSGVYDYESSEMRKYCRSTAAHNTVEINGADQCELWGTFRVARRGYPQNVQAVTSEGCFILSGSHSGYHRLPGNPTHSRMINWDSQLSILKVSDTVQSKVPVRAVSRIHLHPDCSVKNLRDGFWLVEHPSIQFAISVEKTQMVTLVDSWYCPEFGVKKRNTCMEIKADGSFIKLEYTVLSQFPITDVD